MENEFLRITLTVGKSAFIEDFTSKSQGRNLAAPMEPRSLVPLFQVDLYRNGAPTTLGPDQADALKLVRIDSQTVEVRAEFRAFGLTVRQKLELKRGSRTGSFSMACKLDGPGFRLGVARLPGLGLSLDAGSEATALLPVADGALLHQPVDRLKDGEKRSYNYPGLASVQLLAAYDKRGGALAFAADGKGDFKMLVIQRYGKRLVLTFENVLYHLDPPDVALPYTVEIGAFEGGWERAADIYKQWAVKQPWCRTLLQDRKLPPALGDTRFTLGANLRECVKCTQPTNRVADVPKLAQDWAKELGMPVNLLLYSWEKHGPWIAPDYFPPYGGEPAFKRMVGALHGQGQQCLAYLSGFNVTLDKTVRPGCKAFKAGSTERNIASSAIIGMDGRMHREGRPVEGTGQRAVLCPSTAMARKGVAESFRKLRSYGVDRIQLDQVVGGGTPPCFSDKHGHRPVGGNSMYTATASLLDSLAALDPSAVLSLEEPGELFIPHVHLFDVREYLEGNWPRDGAGISGVPLFNYLYHEYSLGFSGDSAPISRIGADPTVSIFAQASIFINGRAPGAVVWMEYIPISQVHDAQRRFMRDVAGVWKGPAGIFLRQGELLTLDDQPAPPLRIQAQAVGQTFDVSTVKLFARAYRLANGRMAAGYVNITGAPLTVDLRFATKRAGIPGNADVLWPIAAAGASASKPAPPKTIKSGESYTFPPYGILFLEIKT
ncbi:MAG TPA: DUF6259 domain-containing protein [Fibrobacteria bacterium]|nr:DUF6259 domain-containing protein [Fibrobacteria bacterium]